MDTSYLSQQVSTIITKLHGLYDEMGVPAQERDARDSELFESLSKTLQNHVQHVTSEKDALVNQAQHLVHAIQQLERSLDDTREPHSDDHPITAPLFECVRELEETHNAVKRLHQERFEEVKKLIEALQSYSSHLEPSFVRIAVPTIAADGSIPPTSTLTPVYINSVEAEFTRVYEEYTRRGATVKQTAEQIVMLWAELGTPQAQTEDRIVQFYRDAPEQLGLHQDDMKRLTTRRDKLLEEKRQREKKLNNIKTQVETLWDRLSVEEPERKVFMARTRGCGLKTINDFEDELSRLNELKRQNLHVFVEHARARLQELWDELYISEEEAVEFTPLFCDVYSDALLSAHEAEIERLETLKEQRAPTLALINKHRSLVKDRDDLAASSQDASRLLTKGAKGEKRDPTRLLREEKMRKRITKELPKVEQELAQMLEQWEEEYGRPFLVFGQRYVDVLNASASKAPPPRSKTPNGLPPRAAVKATPKFVDLRAPSTMRPKTPAGTGTIGRNTVQPSTARPATATSNHTRSPSKIPSRVPLGSVATTNPSPSREIASTQGQENSTSTLRKPHHQAMVPPPKMRQLFEPPPAVFSTPSMSNTFSNDFSRSGSIVRNITPEDPYSSVPRPLPTPTMSYHTMAPPPRPTYHRADSVVSTTSSAYSNSTYGGGESSINGSVVHINPLNGRTTRDTSATSHTTGVSSRGTSAELGASSENWESFGDGEDAEPERDASGEYYEKVRQAVTTGTPRSGGVGVGLGLRMGGNGAGSTMVGRYAGVRAQGGGGGRGRQASFDDETF